MIIVDYTSCNCRGSRSFKSKVGGIAFVKEQDSGVVMSFRGGNKFDPSSYTVLFRWPEDAKCWLDFV